GVRVPGSDPRRRQQARAVRGHARQRAAARLEHAPRKRRRGEAFRGVRYLVWYRAGVHVLRGLASPRLSGHWLSGAAGRLLLRRKRDALPEDGPRRLERRWRAHELLDERDA